MKMTLPLVKALEGVRTAESEEDMALLIEAHRLTPEMIPLRWLRSAPVWEALLPMMEFPALIRNLPVMADSGVLGPRSPSTALAVLLLTNRERIARSRVHPLAVLSAMNEYRAGKTPLRDIEDALDEAFYIAFRNVAGTGRRLYFAIDASASMRCSACTGLKHTTAIAGAAAMALSIARTEANPVIAAFHEELREIVIGPKDRLEKVVEAMQLSATGANASLPVRDALSRKLSVDAFLIVTDNPGWPEHADPANALAAYRRQTGIAAKLVVIAMSAERARMAGGHDPLRLDVAGFDATVPAVVSDFIRHS